MFRELAHQSGFSIERLASLCEVAEAGSIGQASRGDANRQSLLSRQIAELEAVFGVPLLARQARPFRLTAEGRELAQAARLLFQTVGDLRQRLAGEAHRVVLGAGEMLIQWLLFPACDAIQRRDAGMTFAFKNLDSERLVDAVQQGEVDLALMRREDVPPSFEVAEALEFQQAAFVPRKISAAKGPVQPEELASLPWVVLEGRGHFRSFLEHQAQEAGVRLKTVMECSSYTQVAMAVRTGRYAGFLPEFARSAFAVDATILQRPLGRKMTYKRSLVLAWKATTLKNRPFLQDLVQSLCRRW
jgi:DNA-binding transcriptional LysR family regulator